MIINQAANSDFAPLNKIRTPTDFHIHSPILDMSDSVATT